MKRINLIIICVFFCSTLFSQGRNNTWLIGNSPAWPLLGRFVFDASSYTYTQEPRKMSFEGTEATISDEQGNFLMSSNGVWIANATGDTMMNGSGLNPGYYVNSWPDGLIIPYGNMFLPYPGDSNQYVLIHHTRLNPLSRYGGIFHSVIDITADSGLGSVVLKNDTLLTEELTQGLAATRHANGRDWWIVALKDSSNEVFTMLYSANGMVSVSTQSLNYSPCYSGNVSQTTFSQDGTKIALSNYDNPVTRNSFVVIADFDRCTGMFSNVQQLQLTSGSYIFGLAFSTSGNYLYANNSQYIFQIETNTLTVDTVAIFDGFISGFPPTCCATTFFLMYLASNGKIYATSGSSTQHIHEINFPDSAGVACDVQQHAINVGVWQLRAVPNHPNYYLGAADGTVCDSLGLNSLHDTGYLEQSFKLKPNPNNGNFEVLYLLPQGAAGTLEVYDISGKMIYSQYLPPWSTMQGVSLPESVPAGLYNTVIRSEGYYAARKFVLH